MSDKNTPAEAGRAVVLTLQGRRSETPRLPTFLSGTGARSRSAETPDGDSIFFPPGFLTPRQTIELNTSAPRRGDPVSVEARTVSLTVAPDDLVVLELADGSVFLTLGERLQGDAERT